MPAILSRMRGAFESGSSILWAVPGEITAPEPRRLDLSAIYGDHAELVWRSLQRFGVRDHDLEDLLQEVFVIVHQKLHTFDAAAPLPPWLFGICRRVAARHRRRAYLRRETLGEPPERADTDLGPEQAAMVDQARAELNQILDALDLDVRAVLVMSAIDELPREEIAAILGIPVGTVDSRLHAARREFDRALARRRARSPRGDRR